MIHTQTVSNIYPPPPPSNTTYPNHQQKKQKKNLYLTLGNDIVLGLGDLSLFSPRLENNNDLVVGIAGGLGAILGDG